MFRYYFPARVRSAVSDFAVVIALFSMTALSRFLPSSSNEGRASWLVNPLSASNPWWSPLSASLPALLGTMLVLMDQLLALVLIQEVPAVPNYSTSGCSCPSWYV